MVSLLIIPVQTSDANHKICEICDPITDSRAYLRVQYIMYIDISETPIRDTVRTDAAVRIDIKNTLFDKLIIDENTLSFKEIPLPTKELMVGNTNELVIIQGHFTFNNDSDASRMYSQLVTLSDSITVRNNVEFIEIYLLSNTHHYPNPLPDVIIAHTTIGDKINVELYNSRI